MTPGLVYDDGETTVTLWTRHGVVWERMTDPSETRYFHKHDDVHVGVLRGYRLWLVLGAQGAVARFLRFDVAIEHGARLVREVCGDGCRQTRRGPVHTDQEA